MQTNETNEPKKTHWGKNLGGPLANDKEAVLRQLIVEGIPRTKVAETYGVTYQAVYQFLLAHKAEAKALHDESRKTVNLLPVANRYYRMHRLNWLLEKMVDTVEQRANQYQDTGLLAHEPRWVGPGELGEVRDIARFDASLVREFRELLHDAALQLGELPKPNITIEHTETEVSFTEIQMAIQQNLTRLNEVTKGTKKK